MIYEAIKMSKVFVLIQSQSSVESDEVPKEIRLAIKFKKTIIPFVIEVRMGRRYCLPAHQYSRD